MHGLHEFEVSLSPHQIRKLKQGHPISLAAHQLHAEGAGIKHKLMVHHETHKRLTKAKHHRKGARLQMGPYELQHSGSLWDTIREGFNKYVKPVLSGIGDAIAYSNPELAPIREGVRSLTGVGLRPAKGSQAAKDKMAAVRAAKHHKGKSGSFRL